MSVLTNDSNSVNRSPRMSDQNPIGHSSLEAEKDKGASFRSRVEELVKLVEPLRENANRFNATINENKEKILGILPSPRDNEQVETVQRYLKAVLFRLDPLVESVFSLIEDDNRNETAKDLKQKLNNTTSSVLKVPIANVPQKPPSTNSHSKAAPKAQSTKAPPPPSKGAESKKAPALKDRVMSGTGKPDAEEIAKIDTDLVPEQMPEPNLVPKPILWQGIARIKIAGSVWDNLLKEDRVRPTALSLRQRLESANSETPSEPASETITKECLKTLVRFEVDFKNLNELFFEKAEDKIKGSEKKTSIADAAAAAAKTRVQTILDPKRTQLIEISLKSLNLDDDFTNIQNAVDNLIFDEGALNGLQPVQMGSSNEDQTPGNRDSEGYSSQNRNRKKPWGLNLDRLERLIPAHPTPDEVNSLKTLFTSCTADQKIAQADRFLLALSRIDRFPERASSCLTRLTFEKDAGSIAEKLLKLLSVVDSANDSLANGVFKSILALIVKAGNYINCRSRRALVSGIQVSALESLKQVKSIDGKKTFIRVIAEHIEKQFPLAWKQIDWLSSCTEASDISPLDVKQSLDAISRKLKVIETELARPEVNEKYKQFFSGFYEQSAKRIASLDERIKEAQTKLMALAGAMAVSVTAEKPKEMCDELAAMLKKLGCFGKDLFAAHRELQQEETRRKDVLKTRKLRESAQRDRDRKTSTGSANGGRSSFRKNTVTPVLSTLQSETSDDPLPNSPFQPFGGRIATLSGSTPTNYPDETMGEGESFGPETGGRSRAQGTSRNLLKSRQSVPSQLTTVEVSSSRFPETVDKIPAVRSVVNWDKKGKNAREGKTLAQGHHQQGVARRERFSEMSPQPETPVTPSPSVRRNRSTFHPTTQSGCSSNLSRSGGPTTTDGNQGCYHAEQMPTFPSPASKGRPTPRNRQQIGTENRLHSLASMADVRATGYNRPIRECPEDFASGDPESDVYQKTTYQAVSRQNAAATRQHSVRTRFPDNSDESLFLARERPTPAQSPPTSARSHLTRSNRCATQGNAGMFENQGGSTTGGAILPRMVDNVSHSYAPGLPGWQLNYANRTVSAGCARVPGTSVGVAGHATNYNGRAQTEKPIYFEGSPPNEYGRPQLVLDHPGQSGSPTEQIHDGMIFVHQSPGSTTNWIDHTRQQWRYS